MELPSPSVSCELCGKAFRTNAALKVHEHRVHGVFRSARQFVESDGVCPFCQRCFQTRLRAVDHISYRSRACPTLWNTQTWLLCPLSDRSFWTSVMPKPGVVPRKQALVFCLVLFLIERSTPCCPHPVFSSIHLRVHASFSDELRFTGKNVKKCHTRDETEDAKHRALVGNLHRKDLFRSILRSLSFLMRVSR